MTTRPKIIAALSGGVDSSVAAALYQRRGYEVIGATLRLKHPDPAFSAAQTCASRSDQEAVEQVCAKLGIEHVYLDEYADFVARVLRPAYDEYAAGRTPNPCCGCNPRLKFGKLLALAETRGAAGLITGHYARLVRTGDTVRLRRGSDPNKDQTYFLYRLSAEQLNRLHFPIGELDKATVRAVARQFDLKNSEKKDSQDACFNVPGECFAETLRRLFGAEPRPGHFLYHGKVVGRHAGIHRYTIGQRKGLGVALGIPAYVRSIDPLSGDIELTTDGDELLTGRFEVHDWHRQSAREDWTTPRECLVQIRYRSRAVPARLEPLTATSCQVTLQTPQRAVTPGQAAVFYDGEFLLGGGVIVL